MRVTRGLTALVLVLALAGVVTGCAKEPEQPALQPKIAPPVIGEAGILRVGLDLDYPPFAGTDEGVNAGIDVDVAAAIAERLGLQVRLVDIRPAELAAALNAGTIDVGFAAVPLTDVVLADIASAGSYLIDGPAMYSVVASGSVPTTLTAEALAGKRVGVQKESQAYWGLQSDYGEGFAMSFDNLRQAFDALVAGEVDVVVGDAAVCAYIARDYTDIRFVGQYGDARPLGVAVKKDATQLETEVRTVLDALASEGVLDTIRRKWLGDQPTLQVLEVPAG